MKSQWGRASAGLLLLGLLGCGDDSPTNPGNGGGGGTGPPPPFDVFEISLQPTSIVRPTPGAQTPNPLVVEHALSVFASGGAVTGLFDWTVPASIGTVGPKTPQLTVRDYTVVLKLRDDGMLPLGMFTVRVRGESGTERDSLQAQFAVVENTWMKHKRQVAGMFLPDLTRSPVVYSPPGTLPENDLIYYCEAPSATTTTLRSIRAHAPLDGPEQDPEDVILLPDGPEGNNYSDASKTEPDVAPQGLGRDELLFSSTMDLEFADRCPCDVNNRVPTNLWVVRRGAIQFQPRPLTFDSTRVGPGGGIVYYAYNYVTPRWDPSATGSSARISFLTTRDNVRNLWLADLVDLNGDQTSDTLMHYRQLTTSGVAFYDWHPDGTRIAVISGQGFGWVNSTTGAFEAIALPDSDVTGFDGVSVFAPPGQHTLVAFQAARENLSNIYVFDEVDRTLMRVLPVPGSIDQPLQLRWHPRRKEIVYVGDYTVEAWANSSGGPGSPPDLLNPLTPELFGQRRTRFPSVWALRLEAP